MDVDNKSNICSFLATMMARLTYDYSDYYFIDKQSCKNILLHRPRIS